MSHDGLSRVAVELEWDGTTAEGKDFDLDASVVVLNDKGMVEEADDFVRFNRAEHGQGREVLLPPPAPKPGKAKNYTEQIPTRAERVVVAVSIRGAQTQGLTFSDVENATIRLIDKETDEELLRFDLSEDFSGDTSVLFGEFYRHDGIWQFEGLGEGVDLDVPALARRYGIA